MAEVTVEQAFQIAVQHHQAGRLPQAEQLYRQILAQEPNHADAWHYLGAIAYQVGRHDDAAKLMRLAIAFKPNFPEANSNLGKVLKDMGRFDESIAACRAAIALKPDFADAHYNLGYSLQAKGQLDEAIAAYRRAFALQPSHYAAHSLGISLHAAGQLVEAIAAYRNAISLKPDNAEAFSNLGYALKDKGQLDEAIAAYRQSIALNPNLPEAHNNLGNVLRDKGQLDDAIAACRAAITLRPTLAEAHNNLAAALRDAGRVDEAITACRTAIALKPGLPEAHKILGNVLKAKGELDGALAAYRRAMALKPTACDAHSNLLLAMHYHPGCSAQAIAEEHRQWNRQHAEPLRNSIRPHGNDRSPDRRLRIGYVSPDFRDHAVGRFILPLLAHHDKSQFEIHAYAQVSVPDDMTRRLRAGVDSWRSIVGVSDVDAADLIRQDRIDVLVDLTMHTANNRLLVFARKPAPVQVTYLAYCSTTGLETIDYRLSDPYLDPPGGEDSVYSEQTIRLPETYWCYQPSIAGPLEVGPMSALELGRVTFGCLNNFSKVNELVLAVWAKILRAVPNSRLLLHAHEGSHREQALQRIAREGIDRNRIEFVGYMPAEKYLALYRRIDIALDTFPYGGGTTTCDALWMGVPVVSRVGNTAVGRGGLSILSNIGLPELAEDSDETYVRQASELARDLPRLNNLRSTLRRRMEQSPLMDAPRFARNIEAAYRRMWRKWCAAATAS